jgi:hypothetical protein
MIFRHVPPPLGGPQGDPGEAGAVPAFRSADLSPGNL